eukprot:TRINITY_DN2151_c0_g1_i1.p1 TRINITY_DN2151_c0_g1~~TRINITY_DN2151_c0_g1_i1.p1  ORF type:complete len:300 (+),score=74.02 TRINITY_DN2151_c0_g1_i1:116-1015(+)
MCIRDRSGMLFGSAKIRLELNSPKGAFMLLAFDKSRDAMLNQLRVVLKMKSWTHTEGAAAEQVRAPVVGLAGLDMAAKVRAKQQTAMTDDAFSDLDSLVQLAKPMVDLAQRMDSKLKANTTPSDEDLHLAQLLENVGIHNPVTKASMKQSQFHRALAQEVSEAMKKPLAAARGMIVLPDVYCIHSRMRGTQLVSPQDLLEACQLLEPLGLGMRVHTFASGVVVLRAASHDDQTMCDELQKLVSEGERQFVSVLDVAEALEVSVLLAEEYVRMSEQRGVLCRDQSFEATRFFPNKFCCAK